MIKLKADYIKILKAMKQLEIPIERHELRKTNRIFIQKFTYILKKLGFELSSYNDYNFYLNGVYSPHLTQDYYQIPITSVNESSIYLSQRELDIIEKYRNNILEHPYFKTHKIEFHEALTTIQYLYEKYHELSEKELLITAKNLKNHLSRKILVISLNVIKKLKFQQDMVTPDLKEEFALWDSLNDGD